jgi:hypothetical protein
MFIVREFSTWALLLLLPTALRNRHRIGFNINHNLASGASRWVIATLALRLPIFYLSGTGKATPCLPRAVRVLDVSAAYKLEPELAAGRTCVVMLSRRSDQYELLTRDELRETVCLAAPQARWIGLDPQEEALSHGKYAELIASAGCVILAYHQGLDTCRHSGVIWDALLAGTIILIPETEAFLDQAGPAVGATVQTYRTARELETKIRSVLS